MSYSAAANCIRVATELSYEWFLSSCYFVLAAPSGSFYRRSVFLFSSGRCGRQFCSWLCALVLEDWQGIEWVIDRSMDWFKGWWMNGNCSSYMMLVWWVEGWKDWRWMNGHCQRSSLIDWWLIYWLIGWAYINELPAQLVAAPLSPNLSLVVPFGPGFFVFIHSCWLLLW